MKCCEKKGCGSFALNLHQEGIDQGALCDRHYWQDQAATKDTEIAELRKHRDAAVTDYTRMQEIALQAESERDEARECVGRLQRSAQAVLDRWNSPTWQWYNQGPTADLMNAMRDALAATPEHLRNA